jgi:hypothetical protein
MGRKNRESLPLLYRLASQGWVCISANYRLRPAVTFPDHLIDAKKVIAWAREHARDYGADPSVVLVAGSSSGGQLAALAALAALTGNDPRYQPGSGETDPFSPLAYSGVGAPPLFIAHGDRDPLIPVETARLFAERMRGGSASPVVYAELPGAQHGFDRFHSIRFEQVVDAVADFAAWVHGGAHPRGSADRWNVSGPAYCGRPNRPATRRLLMTTLPGRPNTALLVIDVQNGVVAGTPNRDAVIANINTLLGQARAHDVPVIWVQHSGDGLSLGSDEWQYVPELVRDDAEPLVQKNYGDSFEATDLEEVLIERGVGRLIVTGAQTDACIRSTLHGAFTRGYDVTLVGDAHTTEDLTEYGAPTPQQVIAHTNLYWKYQTAPGRTAGTVDTAEVAFIVP